MCKNRIAWHISTELVRIPVNYHCIAIYLTDINSIKKTLHFLKGETEVAEKTLVNFCQRKMDQIKKKSTLQFTAVFNQILSYNLNVNLLFLFKCWDK